MTAAADRDHSPGAAEMSPWVRRVIAEMVRGRHVILHGNVHDIALWQGRFVPVSQILRDVLYGLGFRLIGRYDQLDGLVVEIPPDGRDGSREFAQLLDQAPAGRPADAGPAAGAVTPARQARCPRHVPARSSSSLDSRAARSRTRSPAGRVSTVLDA